MTRADRRLSIIAAGFAKVARGGRTAPDVDALAEAAQVSQTSVYYWIDGKAGRFVGAHIRDVLARAGTVPTPTPALAPATAADLAAQVQRLADAAQALRSGEADALYGASNLLHDVVTDVLADDDDQHSTAPPRTPTEIADELDRHVGALREFIARIGVLADEIEEIAVSSFAENQR